MSATAERARRRVAVLGAPALTARQHHALRLLRAQGPYYRGCDHDVAETTLEAFEVLVDRGEATVTMEVVEGLGHRLVYRAVS